MQFLYPQMFLLLFIPTLILFYFMITARSKVMQIFSDEVYEKLSLAEVSSMGRSTRIILIFVALLLMIVAFARPVIDKGEREIMAKGNEIVIGLDISRSMDARDIYPSRLEAAIRKVKVLLETMGGDKVAIVAFAKDSYIISPMTKDKQVAAYLLETLDLGRFEDRSSNMEAIVEAAKMLTSTEEKTLLILSDGDEGDLAEIKNGVNEAGITVYAIGLAEAKGTPIDDGKGGYLNDDEGNIVISSLNPSLKELALESGGAYTDFTLSGDDIVMLYEQIAADKAGEVYEEEKIRDLMELFYYPLGLGILFLLVAFHSLPQRSGTAAALLFVLIHAPGYSASFDFGAMEQAKQYYDEGAYRKALGAYAKIGGLDKDSEAARLHNMGNSYFKLGQYDKAAQEYEKSLKLDNNADTRHNLELAKKRRQEQKQQQQNKDGRQNKQQQQDQKGQKKQQQSKEEQQPKSQKEQSKDTPQSQKKGENNPESEPKQSREAMDAMEERRWMKELDKKPNPVPLKKLPVTKGEKRAKSW